MFADELRRAVEAAPRVKLPDVAALMWRAFGEGHVTEAEAEGLSALIETRKAVPVTPESILRKSVGSRPRTDASLARRRQWAASGRLPPALASQFTQAEAAVLSVIATEVVHQEDCRLAVGHVAALAGVSETTVRNAVREAKASGLITVEERRLSMWRSDTNVIRISSETWKGWLRLARQPSGGGCKSPQGTTTQNSRAVNSVDRKAPKSCRNPVKGPIRTAIPEPETPLNGKTRHERSWQPAKRP